MSRDRHTVLHVLAPGPVGGMESVVESLARSQKRAGYRPAVAVSLTEDGPSPPLLAALEREGVDVVSVRATGRAYLSEARFIARTIRALKPRVVHTHGYRSDIVGGLVAGRRGAPRVTTVHGFTGGGRKNLAYEWLQRRAFRRFDAVVAVSAPLGRELRGAGVDPGRLHVIPNAWSRPGDILPRQEARDRLGIRGEEVAIGWVGRVTAEKGPDVAVEALAALRDPAAGLHVLGDGSRRASVEGLARRLGVADRAHWHGTVPGAAELFTAFDVLVLSSRTEGTPIVLFEAMQAGVPIVATTVGGVPDVISSREGWLVEPDDPVALARAVENVLGDPEEAERRVAAARRKLEERFGAEDWVRRYEEVYRLAAGETR